MSKKQNKNAPIQLIVGDSNKVYPFYETADEKISVQFTIWDEDRIKEALFTLHSSTTQRELVKTGICPSLPGKNISRLSLHSLYKSKKPEPKERSVKLAVDSLKISSGEILECAYIKYYDKEPYDSKWTCKDYTNGVPDVKKGSILVGFP